MGGLALISTIVFVLVVFKFRMALRAKQDIEGGAFADCCLSLWCTSCVLCQLHNQQDFEEQNGGGDGKTPGGQNISRAWSRHLTWSRDDGLQKFAKDMNYFFCSLKKCSKFIRLKANRCSL